MSNSDSLPVDGGETTPIKIPSGSEDPVKVPLESEDPIKIPSETEDPIATPDPLLGSGSFIDPNNGAGADQNASKETSATADNSADPSSDSLLLKRTRPSWLPENFEMILRKRTSGATEGTVDRYYISPSGHRLRSKNEVLNFLETGSKKKKAAPNSDDATSEGSAPQSKKKKTGARKKVHAAFTFDFKNPPEKVSWCLSYAMEDVWSPSMGDWNVPLATKQEWAAVFNHVC